MSIVVASKAMSTQWSDLVRQDCQPSQNEAAFSNFMLSWTDLSSVELHLPPNSVQSRSFEVFSFDRQTETSTSGKSAFEWQVSSWFSWQGDFSRPFPESQRQVSSLSSNRIAASTFIVRRWVSLMRGMHPKRIKTAKSARVAACAYKWLWVAAENLNLTNVTNLNRWCKRG